MDRELTTPTYNTYGHEIDPAALGLFVLLLLACIIVVYAVYSYLLSRVFKKAGVASWKAWVPVYNNWITLELGGQRGFWAVLALVPIVNLVSTVFLYIAMYHIGLRFGKEEVFVVLAIFLPLVWLAWLGFDDSTWRHEHTGL